VLAEDGASKSQILDPTVTERCRYLIGKRDEVVRLKQRATELERRAQKALKNIPSQKKSLTVRMESLVSTLQQEIKIYEMRIEIMNEEIIRKGCPGVGL
jgi:predicted  nucleic acid-binding Zn-ribbon protein